MVAIKENCSQCITHLSLHYQENVNRDGTTAEYQILCNPFLIFTQPLTLKLQIAGIYCIDLKWTYLEKIRNSS